MVPYPSDFPTSALTLMLDKARGRTVPVGDLVHACWIVVGYGLGQTLPGGQMIAGEIPAGWDGSENDEAVLEYAIKNGVLPEGDDGVVRGVIPWVLVAKIALRLLKEVLL
jgi:hypothetical protein